MCRSSAGAGSQAERAPPAPRTTGSRRRRRPSPASVGHTATGPPSGKAPASAHGSIEQLRPRHAPCAHRDVRQRCRPSRSRQGRGTSKASADKSFHCFGGHSQHRARGEPGHRPAAPGRSPPSTAPSASTAWSCGAVALRRRWSPPTSRPPSRTATRQRSTRTRRAPHQRPAGDASGGHQGQTRAERVPPACPWSRRTPRPALPQGR